MDRNQLSVVPPKTFNIAETLAQTAEQLLPMVQQMASAIIVLDKQVHTMSAMLDKRLTVSSAQARRVAGTVKERAQVICEQNALAYATAGKQIREAMWRALRQTYQVPSHYDLPEKYYENALEYIGGWMPSFAMIRRLRQQ